MSKDPEAANAERQTRESRLTMRATARQRALIQQAAQASNKSVTDFVLESASIAAEAVLAARRWFVLSEEKWSHFQAVLERPVVYKPRLKALLDEPSPFEQ